MTESQEKWSDQFRSSLTQFSCMGSGTILKVGGHKCTSKNYGKFLWV